MTGKTFPAFPAHAQPAILGIWLDAHTCRKSSTVIRHLQLIKLPWLGSVYIKDRHLRDKSRKPLYYLIKCNENNQIESNEQFGYAVSVYFSVPIVGFAGTAFNSGFCIACHGLYFRIRVQTQTLLFYGANIFGILVLSPNGTKVIYIGECNTAWVNSSHFWKL